MLTSTLLAALAVQPAMAQSAGKVLAESPAATQPWTLQIRILIDSRPASRLKARDWSELFQSVGSRVTIATDTGREASGVHTDEKRRRTIRVVGLTDRQGRLRIADQSFSLQDPQKLERFLDDLRTHGVGGPVRDRPTWGLSEGQYQEVLKSLSAPAPAELRLRSPVQTVESFNLPQHFYVTWTKPARQIALTEQSATASTDISGLSSGCGLAAALAQFGLGFRVMENPDRNYLLEIDVGDESSNMWPVGWKNTAPLANLRPALFRPVAVDLPTADRTKVADLIDTIADRIGVIHIESRHFLREAGKDLSQLEFSRKPGRISPWRLMREIGITHGIGIDTRTDEVGRLFLWSGPKQDISAWKKRFAHVIPGKAAPGQKNR